MAEEKFEGDLNQISSRQLKYIAEILDNKGFQGAKVTIKSFGEVGDNYAANVKRITAEKDGKLLQIIAKVAPKIEQLRLVMNAHAFFLNEHVIYTEILPKFTELEKAAGIPVEERFKYAACYGTIIEDYEELILLEDMAISGFTMLDRFKPLTDIEIRLVLKNLARLHSFSYALKYQEPDTYNKFTGKIIDLWDWFFKNDHMISHFQQIEDDCIAMCDHRYKDLIKGTAGKIMEIAHKLDVFNKKSRFSVIQQGDSWTNNILFKLQEGKAVSCCMIDYQLTRVSSPVVDLQYMLFNCTDHETRKQHLSDWIDYYHFELEKRLDEFGLIINDVYARDQLDADMKRHGKLSLATSMNFASMLCREKESARELKDAMENVKMDDMDQMMEATKASNMDEKTVSRYKYMVEGVLETCLHFDLL